MLLILDGEGLVVSILLMVIAAIIFGPPIIGYFMIQSVDDASKQLGWFLLIGYPIILILLCILSIWWYKKTNTNTNTNTESLLS